MNKRKAFVDDNEAEGKQTIRVVSLSLAQAEILLTLKKLI